MLRYAIPLGLVGMFVAFSLGAADPPQTTRYQIDVPGGTVRDAMTQLTWQRDSKTAGIKNRSEAHDFCAGLKLGGKRWRLPTVMELWSLVDLGHPEPTIDPAAFPDTPAENFWTSSRYLDSPTLAWSIGFEGGAKHGHRADLALRVRCVR